MFKDGDLYLRLNCDYYIMITQFQSIISSRASGYINKDDNINLYHYDNSPGYMPWSEIVIKQYLDYYTDIFRELNNVPKR